MNDQSESKPEEKNAPATVEPGGKSGSNKIIFIALAVFALGVVATFLVARSGDDGGGSTGESAQTSETGGNQDGESAVQSDETSGSETSDQTAAETGSDNRPVSNPSTTSPTPPRADLIEVGTLSDRYVEWTDPADFARYANFERWLYFHADWCPKCVALNKDIESNADQIPEDLVIFKVDFDREEELKQNYGVRFQTTVLRVDSQGDPEREFVGATEGHTLDELLGILR